MTAASAPDLSVLMVAFNNWSATARALETLLAQDAPGSRIEIVLMDNGSSDETERAAARLPSAVRYVRLAENLGFAVANNRGLPLCRAPLVFVLNNDVVAPPGSVRALLEAAAAHPDFAVFAPQMIQLKAPERVDNRGLYLDRTGHFRQVDTGCPVAGGPGRSEVFGASGGACLVRRELLARAGLFDEGLYAYLEDGDFAVRARAQGARCLYVPEAHVLHEGSATYRQWPDRKWYWLLRNMRLLRRRWVTQAPWTPIFWLAHAYEWYQLLRAAKAGHLAVAIRARRDGAAPDARTPAWTPEARRRVAEWIGVRRRPMTP